MKHLLKVLKLNSAHKWQTRYLTVSKEGTWLNIDDKDSSTLSNNACFCPLGILWMKKRKGRGRCLENVEKHGKGGMLFVDVLFIEIVPLGYEEHSDLVQKKLFRSKLSIGMKILKDESAIVRIYSKPNINGKGVKKANRCESGDQVVTFMCSMVEAEAITAGCNAIIDTLKRNESQKQGIKHREFSKKKDNWMQKIGLSNSHDSYNTVGLTRSSSSTSARSNRWNIGADHESCCGSSVSSSHNYVMNYHNTGSCNGSVSSSNNYVMSQRHRTRMRNLMNTEHRRMRHIDDEDEDDDPIPESVSYYHDNVMPAFENHSYGGVHN